MRNISCLGVLLAIGMADLAAAQTHMKAEESGQQEGNPKTIDWRQFRGPCGLGISNDKRLPLTWSAEKNVVWRTELPGPGASSPITVGERIFVTCYSGYGVDAENPGNVADLKRHLLCVNRSDGKILWNKVVEAKMPEPPYRGSMQRHGYASSTPASDGERAYVFFGKSGVFAFDLNGRELWHADVGPDTHEWGTGASPVIYKDLVIVNASIESESLVALDKRTGKETWRADGIKEAYDTPHFVDLPSGETELVLSIRDWLFGFDPATGKRLWSCEAPNKHNNNPSAVAHDGVVYCIVSGPARSALAVRAGGRGDVTNSHILWKSKKGSNVSSPIYHKGHVYFVDDILGIFYCLDAKTGEIAYEERLVPPAREIYASPVLADGKLFYVSRRSGTFVLSAKPKFDLLAQNDLGDTSVFNASPVVNNGQWLLRSDRYLYCIGQG